MSRTTTKLLSFAAAIMLCAASFPAQAQGGSIPIRVLNSSTGQSALDPTVTVNGHVLTTAANGTNDIPADHTDGWSLWNPRNRYTDIGLIQEAAPAGNQTASTREQASR